MPQNRRRSLLKIVPGKTRKLQLKFFVLIVSAIISTVILVALGFYFSAYLVLSTAELGTYAEARIADMSQWIWILFVCVIIIASLISGILSLRLSHRIAGPLYRIEKLLNRIITTGEPEEIKLRPNDELHDFVEPLNIIINKLADKK
ncbi:hypothetical protein ACFLR5_01090 [Elusimicrobiota bacterium]